MEKKVARLKLIDNWFKRRIVMIDDELNEYNYDQIRYNLLVLDDQKKENINIYFHSSGGNSFYGLLLYGTLKMLRSNTVAIVKEASSAACNALQGCNVRKIYQHGLLMIHSPSLKNYSIQYDENFDEEIERHRKILSHQKMQTEKLFINRTGITSEKFNELIILGDRHKNIIFAEEAKKLNFVDEILSDDFKLFK